MADYKKLQGNRSENYRPNDEYYTPGWIFEKLELEFEVDVAAPVGGIPWIPALKSYSKEDDGLAQDWSGRVFMNPPFSQSKPWVEKFIEHRNGIALLPASKAKWFKLICDEIDGMVWLPSTMKFVYNFEKSNNIFMPTGLFAFGEENVEALKRLDIGKVR